jgi:hypothetical protein
LFLLLLQDRQCPADFKEQCNPEGAYLTAILKRHTHKEFAEHSNTSTKDAAASSDGYAAVKKNTSSAASYAADSKNNTAAAPAATASYADSKHNTSAAPKAAEEPDAHRDGKRRLFAAAAAPADAGSPAVQIRQSAVERSW